MCLTCVALNKSTCIGRARCKGAGTFLWSHLRCSRLSILGRQHLPAAMVFETRVALSVFRSWGTGTKTRYKKFCLKTYGVFDASSFIAEEAAPALLANDAKDEEAAPADTASAGEHQLPSAASDKAPPICAPMTSQDASDTFWVSEVLRHWIYEMYAHFSPSKLRHLEDMLTKYSAKGPAGLTALFQALCVKYLDTEEVSGIWKRLAPGQLPSHQLAIASRTGLERVPASPVVIRVPKLPRSLPPKRTWCTGEVRSLLVRASLDSDASESADATSRSDGVDVDVMLRALREVSSSMDRATRRKLRSECQAALSS